MLRQETGIDLNAHCYRHFAARLFLREHPGEYETIRLLLGHKDLSTTTQHYCGLEQADALRRYDTLIDRYRKKEPDDPPDSYRGMASPRSRALGQSRRAGGPVRGRRRRSLVSRVAVQGRLRLQRLA
jgi:hypothetical protein